MRKDITFEKLMFWGEKVNKSELARRYNCCWETIDRILNPEKYKKERKPRVYTSMLDPYKNIIDAKLENDNAPATGIFTLLVLNYGYKGKYGIVRKYVSSIKEKIISTFGKIEYNKKGISFGYLDNNDYYQYQVLWFYKFYC